MRARVRPQLVGILLLAWAHVLSAQGSIVAVEYYLDHDPGPGQGVGVPVVAAGAVDVDFNVTLSNTNPGRHMLYVRVKGEDGVWSLAVSRPILVETVSARDLAAEVAGIEYFLDADPGAGAATAVASADLEVASPLVMAQFQVGLGGLSDGLHTLFVRARDAQGRWGLVTAKPILVETVTALDSAPAIVGMEYYVDQDPGIGAGTEIELGEDGTTTVFTADLATIEGGLHTLFVRSRDARGLWGLGVAKPVLVQSATPISDVAPSLSAVEYFFDSDPGSGAGTEARMQGLSGFPLEIDAAGVEPGLRTLYLRVRDERGQWSIPTSKPVFLDVVAAPDAVPEIIAIDHYLLAADGGGPSPTEVFSSFPAAATVSLDFEIDLGGVSGDQTLVLAARDSRGASSLRVSHSLAVVVDGEGTVDPEEELEPQPSDGTASLDFALVPGDQGVRRLMGAQPGQDIGVRVVLQREFSDFQQVAATIVFDPAKVTPTTGRTIELFAGAFTLAPLVQGDRANFGGAVLVGEPRSGRGEVLELGFTLAQDFSGSTLLELAELSIGPSLEELQTFNPGAAVVVTTATTITGDLNGDRKVDYADLFIFAGGFGSTYQAFDLDDSGEVDLGDFFIFADNFGRTSPS